MHVVIIAGEELNPDNIYASIFELHQAKALSKSGVTVRILSYRLHPSIFKFENFKKNKVSSIVSGYEHRFHKIDNIEILETVIFSRVPSRFNKDVKNLYKKAATKSIEKYISEFGKPQILHAHSRFLIGGLISETIKKQFKIPYVLTEHSSFYARELVSKDELVMLKSIINNAKEFITVSPELGNLVTSMVEPINKKYSYIPNVIDPIFEDIQIKQQVGTTPFVFLNIASLDKNKAQSNLIHAFADKYSNNLSFQLQIAGSGPLEINLKDLVTQLGIEQQVVFLGYLNRKQVKEALHAANVFVLSSLYESFGVVLIEALALGKPLIATKCGGPENIVNNSNGYLVKPNNIEALSNAMQKMVDNYLSFDGEKLKEDCLLKFGSSTFAKTMIPIYKKHLNV